MAETIGLKMTLDYIESANSIKELKRLMKEYKEQVGQAEEGTTRYENALKKVAAVKDKLDELNETFDSLTGGGKFQAIANLGGSIAGGFAAAQGAMALFGSESKELEQSLLKVQAAMALASGLKDLEGIGDAISNAGNAFKSMGQAAMGALKGIKGAVAATGIGLLVVGVGTLIAYWDEIKGFFDTLSKGRQEQEALNSTLEDYTKGAQAATRKITDVQVAFDLAKNGVISKKEALKTYNDTLGDTLGKATSYNEAEKIFIEKTEAYIKSQGLRAQANALFNKAAEEQAKGVTAQMENQVSWYESALNAFNALSGRTGAAAAAQAEAQKKGVEEAKKAAEERKNIFTNLGEDLIKEATEIEAAYKITNDPKKITKPTQDRLEAELEALRRKREMEESERLAHEQFLADITAADDKKAAEDEQRRQWEIKAVQDAEAAKIQASLDAKNKEEADDIARHERQKLRRQAALSLTEQSLALTSALVDAFAGKDEASQRKAFEIQKKVQLAQATIEMIKGVQAAYTSAQMSPFTAIFPGYPLVQAGIAAGFGIANIKKIADTKFEGGGSGNALSIPGGGGGGSSLSVLNNTPQNTSTQLNEDGSVQKISKTYVVASDVTAHQEVQKKIENKNKFE